MSVKLVEAAPQALAAFQEAFQPELVGRNCRLEAYRPIRVPRFKISGEFVTYASPDSTYAVTKRFFDDAQRSILIGIYDFTAVYVKELLLKAMRRGVKVSLMLDLDNRTGETAVFNSLVKHGCDGVPAPSCASDYANYFASSHEKVIVIDDEWTLVQSGNYSENSIPQNDRDGGDRGAFVPGNRDMGVAVRSAELARFFSKVLRSDMRLELRAEGREALSGRMAQLEAVEAFQSAPAAVPVKLAPSKRFRPARAVSVTPVLSPDNYMQTIPGLLAAAEKSVWIEQQYIRGGQEEIRRLLTAIQSAAKKHPQLDVRIVLARPFPGARFAKEAAEIESLKDYGLPMGKCVRILNPKYFVHCHNKLILVDNRRVLISSQNWSDSAVVKNREAGLLIESPEIARYYAGIFQSDWETGLKTVGKRAAPQLYGPESLASGKVVPLNWGDYAEV